MPRSRLFRSIVVFGSSLGAATVFGAAGSAVSSGCELYEGSSHGSGPWVIIDASQPDGACGGRDGGCPDAWWGFIDATPPADGNWGTIADAPNPDAAHAAKKDAP